MAALEEFRFEIPAYTPETMPIERLLEYLKQVAILLGDPKDIHLVGIETASTQPVLAISRPNVKRALQRVSEVRTGGGSERRRSAYSRIKRMVEEDNSGPAILKAPEGATILMFDAPKSVGTTLHGIRQATTVQGTLIRVGGSQENSTVLLQDESGETIAGCYANRTLAKQLAALLYEPVRLSGVGTWLRHPDGKWQLERMQVQSYMALDERPLGQVVRDLQAIPVEWPADTLERLKELRSN